MSSEENKKQEAGKKKQEKQEAEKEQQEGEGGGTTVVPVEKVEKQEEGEEEKKKKPKEEEEKEKKPQTQEEEGEEAEDAKQEEAKFAAIQAEDPVPVTYWDCWCCLEMFKPQFLECTTYQNWLKLFFVECPIVFATVCYYVGDPAGFVKESWNIQADYAHRQLLYQCAIVMFTETFLFYLMMVWTGAKSVETFRQWQIAIFIGDVLLVAQAIAELADGGLDTRVGVAQIVMASCWGGIRLAFLIQNPPLDGEIASQCCCLAPNNSCCGGRTFCCKESELPVENYYNAAQRRAAEKRDAEKNKKEEEEEKEKEKRNPDAQPAEEQNKNNKPVVVNANTAAAAASG